MQSWLSQKAPSSPHYRAAEGVQGVKSPITDHFEFVQCDLHFVTTESTQWACLAHQYGRAVRLNERPTYYGPQKDF